jgi:pimeloyl-ACP methyl ester carboxylesterase
MKARMKNPAIVLPGAVEALQMLGKAGAQTGGLPLTTMSLVRVRVGMINGYLDPSFVVNAVPQLGERIERIHAIAAWRDTPFFTDAERAALALTDAVTSIVGRDDPVPDDVWNEAARYYDEKALASLLICIAIMTVWNGLNISTRQPAGDVINIEEVSSRDGTRIILESRGTGPAVVIVDGPATSRSFAPSMKFASLLADKFTVYTYDRRGRGASGATAPYSVEREVEDLQAVITAVGGENVGVYGTLSGAVLALEAAAAGVTGLGQLVLREPRLASGEGDLRPKLSELLMAGRNGDAVELFLSSTAVSDEFRIARADKFWPAMEASAPAFLYDLTISEESSADRYRSVTLPTLVMDTARDTNDRLRDDALAVAGALPNARHHIIPAAEAGRIVSPYILDVLTRFFTS